MRESESTITDEVPASTGYRRVLDRSVALLAQNTAEARRAIYAHARSVIAAQLVRRDPLPSKAEIERESRRSRLRSARSRPLPCLPRNRLCGPLRAPRSMNRRPPVKAWLEAEAETVRLETGAVSRAGAKVGSNAAAAMQSAAGGEIARPLSSDAQERNEEPKAARIDGELTTACRSSKANARLAGDAPSRPLSRHRARS